MQAFTTLTYIGQAKRLRRVAQRALADYGIAHAEMKLLSHSQNTTFRVKLPSATAEAASAAPYVANQFLLRVHGSDRHGPDLAAAEAIAAELAWLAALRRDTQLAVPEPVATTAGSFITVVSDAGLPQARVCSLLRWLAGRCYFDSPRPTHLYKVGAMMAHLHEHAQQWPLPPGFRRFRWDRDGLFGDTIGFGGVSGTATWALIPPDQHDLLARTRERVEQTMQDLGQGPSVFGLIHADFHLDNVIFDHGEARPIDFDDCGFGYWLYDMAVSLWLYRMKPDWPVWRAAFLTGYASVRPLPTDQLPYLDDFIAAREVSIALWDVGMAQHNPDFQAGLAADLAEIEQTIRTLFPA